MIVYIVFNTVDSTQESTGAADILNGQGVDPSPNRSSRLKAKSREPNDYSNGDTLKRLVGIKKNTSPKKRKKKKMAAKYKS